MKSKQAGFGLVEIIVVMAIAGLVAALGYLTYTNHFANKNGENDEVAALTQMPPLVRGVVGPNVSKTNAFMEAPGLSEALNKIAENNPCAVTEGRFKQIVLGVTEDKTQALIGNSCGSTGVLRTFMVKEGDTWNVVGDWKEETNRKSFSALTDTPSCELVNTHGIQKSIAPVCFELLQGAGTLAAGDMNSYRYIVR